MHSCTNEPGSTWTVGPRATPFLRGIFTYSPQEIEAPGSTWVTLKTGGAMESGKAGRRELGCEVMRCSGSSHRPTSIILELKRVQAALRYHDWPLPRLVWSNIDELICRSGVKAG